MNNLKIILTKSSNFLKIYLKDYLALIKKPVLVGFLGLLSLGLCIFGPIGAILALFISIPCICYSFWRGYLMTYSLNYAADSYAKTDNKVLILDCYNLAKKDGNKLAQFLGFSVLIFVILCSPSIVYLILKALKTDLLVDLVSAIYNPMMLFKYLIAFILNSLVLIPFYNFLNQAFFYRKEKESFLSLFLNCYKKLDKTGIALAIIFNLLTCLSFFNSLLYLILALFLNPLIYCANTIWYKNKIEN